MHKVRWQYIDFVSFVLRLFVWKFLPFAPGRIAKIILCNRAEVRYYDKSIIIVAGDKNVLLEK